MTFFVALSGVTTHVWLLLGAHALCDFALQDWTMVQQKNRIAHDHKKGHWLYWLTAHSLIHGLAVTLILGPLWGLAETIAHAVIDHQKCEGRTNLHVDQALHVACKLAWVAGASLLG